MAYFTLQLLESVTEGYQGKTQERNLETGTEVDTMEKCCLLACSL